MRTLSTLVYIPVLFTLTVACAPKHRPGPVVVNIPNIPNPDLKPTPPWPLPAPATEPASRSEPEVSPSEPSFEQRIVDGNKRILTAKTKLFKDFALSFDEGAAPFPVGIRRWIYTAHQREQIKNVLRQVITEAKMLLELEFDPAVNATLVRGEKILTYFERSST